MINRRLLLTVAVMLMVLVLAACGGNDNGQPANGDANTNNAAQTEGNKGNEQTNGSTHASDAGDTQVELRMSWWGSDERHEKTLQAIEAFEARYPHITITGEYSGFDGYMDKLNTQIAAGNAPDLIQLGGNIKEYVDKNALLDLSPYNNGIIDLSDFNASLVDAATFDGSLYGVTLGVSSSALLYNATMLEQAGIATPDISWTYDDLKDTVIAIADKLGDGYYGIYDLSSDAATLNSYLGSNGKELYRDGERHFEREDIVNWFSLWEEMRQAGALVPPDVQVSNPPTAVDKSLVVKGQVAMQSAAASQIYGFQELTEDTLGLLTYPNGSEGGGMIPPISGQFITAYSGTEHPEEVALFMNFMVNDPEGAVILGSSRGVPPAGKIRDLMAAEATPVDKVMYDYVSLVADTALPIVYQQFPLDNEFIKLLLLTSEKIAFGASSIDQAVDEFMSEFDKLLAKAKAN